MIDQESLLSLEIPLAILICIIYIFSALTIHVIQDRYGFTLWFHESSLSCIVGFIVGGIIKAVTGASISFNGDIFFFMILPPIIFSAGYSLRRKKFFQNIHLIMLFGIGGTIVNFLLIALGAFYFPQLLPQFDFGAFSWQKSLLFASVLAGSDEVSALSLVPIDVFPRMGALIFGEGVMNDALSIVLFESLKPLDSGDHVDFTMFKLLQCIIIQLAGAVVIGSGTGLTLSVIMKNFSVLRSFPVHQTALVMLFGYLSYTVAQCMEISGILTVFVCAVTMAHYAWHSLSKQAQVATRLSAASLSEMAEGFAFSYVGLSFWGYAQHDFHKVFTVYMIVIVLAARAITTFGIAGFIKWQRIRSFDLSFAEQNGLFLGGVVRGCLCWAQVLQLHHCPILVTTTLLIIMVTSISSGVLLPMLLPMLLSKESNATSVAVAAETTLVANAHHDTLAKRTYQTHQEPSPFLLSSSRQPVNRILYQSIDDQSPPAVLLSTHRKATTLQPSLIYTQGQNNNYNSLANNETSNLISVPPGQLCSSSPIITASTTGGLSSSFSQMYHTALDILPGMEAADDKTELQQVENEEQTELQSIAKDNMTLNSSKKKRVSLLLPSSTTVTFSDKHVLPLSDEETGLQKTNSSEITSMNNNGKITSTDCSPSISSSPPIVLHQPRPAGNNNGINTTHGDPSHEVLIFDQSSWTSQEIRSASYLFLQWIKFDEKVMKPFFGGSLPDHRRKRWLRDLMHPSAATHNTNERRPKRKHSTSMQKQYYSTDTNTNGVNNLYAYQPLDEDDEEAKAGPRRITRRENNDGLYYQSDYSEVKTELEDGEFEEDEFEHGLYDDDYEDESVEDEILAAEEEADKENMLSPFLKQLQRQNQLHHSSNVHKNNASFCDTRVSNKSILINNFPPTFQLPLANSNDDSLSLGNYEGENKYEDHPMSNQDNTLLYQVNHERHDSRIEMTSRQTLSSRPLYQSSETSHANPTYSNHNHQNNHKFHHSSAIKSAYASPKVRPISRGLFFHSPPPVINDKSTVNIATAATAAARHEQAKIDNRDNANAHRSVSSVSKEQRRKEKVLIDNDDDDISLYSTTPLTHSTHHFNNTNHFHNTDHTNNLTVNTTIATASTDTAYQTKGQLQKHYTTSSNNSSGINDNLNSEANSCNSNMGNNSFFSPITMIPSPLSPSLQARHAHDTNQNNIDTNIVGNNMKKKDTNTLIQMPILD